MMIISVLIHFSALSDFPFKKLFVIFLVFTGILQGADHTEYPLEIRNQYPPFLIFLEPYPLTPTILEKGNSTVDVDFVQSNSVQYKNSLRNTAIIDMEVSRTSLRYHYGINLWLEAGFEVTMLAFTKGIGDGGIIGYHQAAGFPNGNHDYFKPYSFHYDISEGKTQYFEGKPRSGPGDSTVFLKMLLVRERRFIPAVSFALYAKLPTGSLKNGTGSGKADAATGILLKKSFHFLNIYMNFVGVGISNPFHNSRSYAGSYGAFMTAIEGRYSRTFSVILQYEYKMSPWHSELNQLKTPASIISLGFNKSLFGKHVLQMSFSEDLTHYTVPDVTGQISWKYFLE